MYALFYTPMTFVMPIVEAAAKKPSFFYPLAHVHLVRAR